MNTEQERADFEAWFKESDHYLSKLDFCLMPDGRYEDDDVEVAWEAYQAGRAALQSQDREEIMEMALCESRRLVLRIGQAYRFTPMDGCKTCEEMKEEHDQAYSIDHALRIEGEGK